MCTCTLLSSNNLIFIISHPVCIHVHTCTLKTLEKQGDLWITRFEVWAFKIILAIFTLFSGTGIKETSFSEVWQMIRRSRIWTFKKIKIPACCFIYMTDIIPSLRNLINSIINPQLLLLFKDLQHSNWAKLQYCVIAIIVNISYTGGFSCLLLLLIRLVSNIFSDWYQFSFGYHSWVCC